MSRQKDADKHIFQTQKNSQEQSQQRIVKKQSLEDSTAKGQATGESSGAPDVAMLEEDPIKITNKSSDMMIVSCTCYFQK